MEERESTGSGGPAGMTCVRVPRCPLNINSAELCEVTRSLRGLCARYRGVNALALKDERSRLGQSCGGCALASRSACVHVVCEKSAVANAASAQLPQSSNTS